MADDNEHESSSSCPVGADDAGGFTFYNPSTQDFASVPVSMPDFVSAARLAYGTEGDDDIVWPYDPRQPGPTWDPLPIRAMLDSLPEVQDWLENVPRVPINEEAAFQVRNASTSMQWHISCLRSRPTRGPDWAAQATANNRKLLSLRRETPFDDFTLSYAETVEHLYHNDRAQIAFWAFNRGVLGDSVPDTVQRSGVESTLNWFDSARDLIEENGSIAKPVATDCSHLIASLIMSLDLNKEIAQAIQQGSTGEFSSQHLVEVLTANTKLAQWIHSDTGSAELARNPEVVGMVTLWSDSFETLRNMGMTEPL